jgi:hypothetical protein
VKVWTYYNIDLCFIKEFSAGVTYSFFPHAHFTPRKNEYILSFPPGKMSIKLMITSIAEFSHSNRTTEFSHNQVDGIFPVLKITLP